MVVNLRKKYSKHSGTSKKNSPYRFQLDFYHNGKRIRETISDVEFLPSDTKEQREQKKRVVDKIKADLEIELANKSTGFVAYPTQVTYIYNEGKSAFMMVLKTIKNSLQSCQNLKT